MAREDVNDNLSPYGASDAAEPPPPVETGQRKLPSIGRGNLLPVGLFLGGIAVVYLLSLRGGPAKASAEESTCESQVSAALAELGKAPPPSLEKAADVVAGFYHAARDRQIPVEKLRGNAFVFHLPKLAAAPMTRPVDEPPAPVEDEGARELSDALAAARSLRLQSVLIGTRGATAIIGNNLLSEGQMIQGWTVSRIQAREVVLSWKDQKYVLKMQE
jgi:hypothetical protein